VRRGEIWWASLPDPLGSGPGFRRPVVVVQANPFNESKIQTVVIAIITSNLALSTAPGNVRLSARQSKLPKDSVVNVSQIMTLDWLYLQQPIVIVDEAHNNRTEESFTTLKRLNPAGVIELTATPTKGSNVLCHVSAQALKAEEMIKLPIVLAEHPTGWKDAVRDAILTRKHLETLAQRETDYIRPIVLFQAQAKGGEVTVEVLRKHLFGLFRLVGATGALGWLFRPGKHPCLYD
jgi:mRNA-degrading endonuclease toxin of MazEF toxin-antitoxin module